MKNKKKGFTLVELIVVLAILAILAAMLVPALTGYIDKANEKKIAATARQYYVAAQTVVSDAYASGKEVKKITISASKTVAVYVGGTAEENKDANLAEDFKDLAEIASDSDTAVFVTDGTSMKATDTYVISGKYKAILNANGGWDITDAPSS